MSAQDRPAAASRCGNNGPSCRRDDCPWPEGRCVERDAAANRSFPEREDGMFGGCPIYAEARSANECGKCGGDLLQCPVYGDGERKRQAEDRAAAFGSSAPLWCRTCNYAPGDPRCCMTDPEQGAACVAECSGGFHCPAATHIHGCFGDKHGNCDHPEEHFNMQGFPVEPTWPRIVRFP